MNKFFKIMRKIFGNFWVKLILLLLCMVGIFALAVTFDEGGTTGDKLLEFVTSGDVLSIFLVAAVSLIVASVVIKVKPYLEESLKIEDDHHKIVCKYNKHSRADVSPCGNLYDKNGSFMYLTNVRRSRRAPKNPENDRYSSAYAERQRDIDSYMSGKLYLPSVSVFTNIDGAEVVIDDRTDKYELPKFIGENALLLMGAHETSDYNNGITIRLRDIDYENGVLTLKTERTQYFDMLITNRCMDYKMNGDVSVRGVYEFGSTVSALADSKLSNQIGINGLIITKDGYLLVEKRGNKKSVWKNKFAQPISLAMKKSDVILDANGLIGSDEKSADACFAKIVLGTVKKNFGITEKEVAGFDVDKNLLGVARDLLEGGKPNLYFYVTVDMCADDFAKFLQDKAKRACKSVYGSASGDLPVIAKSKLDSDFYLVSREDIVIDYGYSLKVKAKKLKRIKRTYRPRVGFFADVFDGFGYKLKRAFGGSIKRECGEALLACLYYANMCGGRIWRS